MTPESAPPRLDPKLVRWIDNARIHQLTSAEMFDDIPGHDEIAGLLREFDAQCPLGVPPVTYP